MILSLILSCLLLQYTNTVPGTVSYDRMFNSLTMSGKINPQVSDISALNRKWVQNFIQSSWVSSTGTIYAYSNWDEGNHTASLYKNSDQIGLFEPRFKGVAANWGDIVGDDNYVYSTTQVEYGNWTATGCGVVRTTLAGRFAGFAGGVGEGNSYFYIRQSGDICQIYRNITVNKQKSELYVTDSIETLPDRNMVFVFKTNPAAPAPIDSFNMLGIKDMVADDSGLWIIINDSVKYYSSRGIYSGIYIPGILKPTLISYSRQKELMVWDDSLCIVRFYRFPKTSTRSRTFGLVGGMYKAASENRKFDFKTFPPGLRGMNTDSVGNLYLTWGYGYPSFSDMRVFNKLGDSLWHLYCASFVSIGGFDYMKDGREAFTTNYRFNIDWKKPTDKKETFVGYTGDYRGTVAPMGGRTYVRYVGNKRIIVNDNNDLYGIGISIFYDQGQFLKKAFTFKNGMSVAFYVDYNGDVWDASGLEIKRYRFIGFNRANLPVWDTVNYQKFKNIGGFYIERIIYDKDKDEMLLTGATDIYKKPPGDARGIGSVIRKYSKWTKNRTLAWQDTIGIDTIPFIQQNSTKASIEACGDYIFYIPVAEEPRPLYVRSMLTGQHVGIIYPGAEIQGNINFDGLGYGAIGWIDTPFGLNCIKRNNGQYVITIENDLTANNWVYRWCPSGNCPEN